MTLLALVIAAGGAGFVVGVYVVAVELVGRRAARRVAAPPGVWRQRIRAARTAAQPHGVSTQRQRQRVVAWLGVGVAVWVVTGWPIAGIAVTAMGVWLPWLLGAGRVAQDRIAKLEALEKWCRRMADTLSGGGAIGLAQAITVSSRQVDDAIAVPVHRLAARLQDGRADRAVVLREFTDVLDDRVADTVGAALLLALRQQSAGVAGVLRQLADGVARDVRARREVEAARAESRQSVRVLLVIQAGVLVLIACVPLFAAPYRSVPGQLVMAILLALIVTMLVWTRRLAVGRAAPRFLGDTPARDDITVGAR